MDRRQASKLIGTGLIGMVAHGCSFPTEPSSPATKPLSQALSENGYSVEWGCNSIYGNGIISVNGQPPAGHVIVINNESFPQLSESERINLKNWEVPPPYSVQVQTVSNTPVASQCR